jgi:hypothetical protein
MSRHFSRLQCCAAELRLKYDWGYTKVWVFRLNYTLKLARSTLIRPFSDIDRSPTRRKVDGLGRGCRHPRFSTEGTRGFMEKSTKSQPSYREHICQLQADVEKVMNQYQL